MVSSDTNETVATSAPRDHERAPLRGLRVLVCDDDEDGRELLVHVLAAAGADARGCSSAEEVLAEIRNHLPHVLVSDIGLPMVDGFELMRRIRRLPEPDGGATPAIAVTGYASPADVEMALAVGYQCHAVKPVTSAELIRLVCEVTA